MTYKQFCKFMDLIKEAQDKEAAFSKAIGVFCEGYVIFGLFPMEGYIKILSELAADKATWIDYYIYECEWGKKPGYVAYHEKGTKKEVKLKTYKQLWEVIHAN